MIKILFVLGCGLYVNAQEESELLSVSGNAMMTYYESYPRCCCGAKGTPVSPNCDPNAPKGECDDYSGCKYMV